MRETDMVYVKRERERERERESEKKLPFQAREVHRYIHIDREKVKRSYLFKLQT